MSAAERQLTRRLLVKVARYEMLDARADGRLPGRIPLRLAVKELKRALRERRKLARQLAGMNGLERAIAETQATLHGEPSPNEPMTLRAPA